MEKLEKLYLEYSRLAKNIQANYERFNHYSIVHQSNAIEGSSLTQSETFTLLENNLTPNAKPVKDMNMALDHYDALKYVIEMAEKKRAMSIELIQEINALVMKSTGKVYHHALGVTDETKGDIRKFAVAVSNRYFMSYQKVPQYLKELVNYINENLGTCTDIESCYNLAFEAHYQLVSIHPFSDGNGRTSRLLMNYIQHYSGYPMTLVFAEDRITYFEKLEASREKEDIEIFQKFMKAQACKYFSEEIALMQKKPKEKKIKGMRFLF